MSQHPASNIVNPTGKEDLYPLKATARTHRKTSLIWNYFVHLHPDHIEYGKNVLGLPTMPGKTDKQNSQAREHKQHFTDWFNESYQIQS
jgi:hypothetical protein